MENINHFQTSSFQTLLKEYQAKEQTEPSTPSNLKQEMLALIQDGQKALDGDDISTMKEDFEELIQLATEEKGAAEKAGGPNASEIEEDMDQIISHASDILKNVKGTDINSLNTFNKDLTAILNAYNKFSSIPVNPPAPPNPPVTKTFPFTYENHSGKSDSDIYIQIIGTDPKTGQQCFIKYDSQGRPSYVDARPGLNPADYSFPLSYFPKSPDGKGHTLNLPELNGGRIYTSIGAKMPCTVNYAPKIGQYLICPNLNTSLVMDKTEFTIDKGSVFFNPTAVDDFSLPISVEEQGKDGTSQKGGISSVSRQKIWQEMENEFGKAGGPWSKLISQKPPIIYSPVDAANLGIFPEDYFQKSGFMNAFSQEFSTHDLQVDAGESFPNTGVFKGKYDPATGTMTFTGMFEGKETSVTLKIPNTTSGLLLGNGPSWGITKGEPKAIQALKSALARNISVAIDTNTLTTQAPLSKKYFIAHQKDFYKENPDMPSGLQFIDHYSKVLHSITRDIYTFGYDDEAGQSGGCSYAPDNFKSGTITLGPLG